MKLNDLLNNIPIQAASCDLTAEVAGITLDSRRCKPGYVFCAVVGAESGVPGIRYAQKAVENGAVCVLCDTDCPADLPFVRVADAELALAEVSANFYGHPAVNLRLIGVTGTNGKTTTTHLVRDLLTHAGKKCGLIGTNELMIGDQVITSHPVFSTTPEPPELHALFAQMVEAGCEFAVMEVSSHALALNRVYGLRFEVAAFTNLSQDHLNYHGTMEAYAAAKAKLFRQADCSVINLDDAYAQQMIDGLTNHLRVIIGKIQPENAGLIPRLPDQIMDFFIAQMPCAIAIRIEHAGQASINPGFLAPMHVIQHHGQSFIEEAVAAQMLHAEAQPWEMIGHLVKFPNLIIPDAVPMHAGMEGKEQPQSLRLGIYLKRRAAIHGDFLIGWMDLDPLKAQIGNPPHLIRQICPAEINHAKALQPVAAPELAIQPLVGFLIFRL